MRWKKVWGKYKTRVFLYSLLTVEVDLKVTGKNYLNEMVILIKGFPLWMKKILELLCMRWKMLDQVENFTYLGVMLNIS